MQKSEIVIYEGYEIRRRGERGEHMCLTDMWKAAGGDRSKAPAEWLRSEQARHFTEFLNDSLITGNSHDDVVLVERGGRRPATWAHWQLAFAYAKYLSPAFHAWCNEVVRRHMEGAVDGFAALHALIEDLQAQLRQLSSKSTAVQPLYTNRAETIAIRNLVREAARVCGVTFQAMEGAIRRRESEVEGEAWNVTSYQMLPRGVVPIVRDMLTQYIDGRRIFVRASVRRARVNLSRSRRPVIAKGQGVIVFPRRPTPVA